MIEWYLPSWKWTKDIIELWCNINPEWLALIISQKLQKIPTNANEILNPIFIDTNMVFLNNKCQSCIESVKLNFQLTLFEKYLKKIRKINFSNFF